MAKLAFMMILPKHIWLRQSSTFQHVIVRQREVVITIAPAIHWHIRPCSSVVYVEYTPSSHEQLCSMADRLSFNRFYGTGSWATIA